MTNISIFAKPSFYDKRKKHLYRGSTEIRAYQVANFIGAKINPKDDYEKDVKIYVKPSRQDIETIEPGSYVDIVDQISIVDTLSNFNKINVIACNKFGYNILIKNLKNKIFYIPQHHCNIENFMKNGGKVKTVGVIGTESGFEYPIDELRKRLEKISLNLVTTFDFRNREDVLDHYKKIDIQFNWQDQGHYLKNPLDVINAASFGIPTVCNPETYYDEVKGNYVPVKSVDEALAEIEKFKDQDYYTGWSNKLLTMAKKYHIKKIAKLYKSLK